jgi:hypothetical protein
MAANIDEARKVARSLLNDLETVTVRTEGVLMKAKRLARLMRDADAMQWLDLETSGYPSKFNPTKLGTCLKYAKASGRINDENKYYFASLPALEADAEAAEVGLKSFKPMETAPVVENHLAKQATKELMASQVDLLRQHRKAYSERKSLVISLKSALHSYATDTYLAIEFGDVAQEIFESARNSADAFVRAHCPKAVEQLVAINERMLEKKAESRAEALTSCRRVLLTLADSLFPAQKEDWSDSTGKPRKVGQEQYKNRILAYLDQRQQSEGSQDIIVSGLEHLAARLDAVYSKTSKGVHLEVSEEEARLAVIHVYLLIAEVATHSQPPSV